MANAALAYDARDEMTTTTKNVVAPHPMGRILVVDDEPNICRLLNRYLTRLGYEIETAGSVGEALGLLRRDWFDLVLTDLRLPGASGLDLLVEVRARTPGTRMILMSAHADVHAASTAIERGVDQ